MLIAWCINLLLIGATYGCLMLFRYLSQNTKLGDVGFINIIIINLFNRMIWNILQMVN